MLSKCRICYVCMYLIYINILCTTLSYCVESNITILISMIMINNNGNAVMQTIVKKTDDNAINKAINDNGNSSGNEYNRTWNMNHGTDIDKNSNNGIISS